MRLAWVDLDRLPGRIGFSPGYVRVQTAIAALVGLALLAACQPQSVMTDRPKGPLPWSASIGRLDSDVAKSTCTATLVARDIILTASHCLFRNGGRAQLTDFYFLPALSTGQSFLPRRVVGMVALGDEINPMQPGAEDVARDWAMLKIDPAIDYLAPLPILGLSPVYLAARLAAGDRLSSAGYGIFDASGGRALKQQDCQLIVDGGRMLRLEGEVIVSDCNVIQGDSGGPILLRDSLGIYRLVGIVTGYWRSDDNGDVASFGPSAALFAQWMDQAGIDQVGIDQVGIDQVGIDQVGIDQVGIAQPIDTAVYAP